MNSIFENTKVLICVGSGGVGKTTIAASLAVLAAQEGKKVLVLTIDPAKRLAQTLGIEGSQDITRVPNQNFIGEIYASVIDHKKTFDAFVERAAQKEESAKKILNNRLYQQLSTNLSGSQEFTSLEKLYSCYESKEFDLIILDTPPTKHAIDFLNAPQRLASLFNEGVAKWFRDPEGKKGGVFTHLLQSGTRQVLKVLETLTGSQFIRELADFFQQIERWQGQLLKRTVDVQRMLVSPQTRFCLVTGFDMAKLKEAEYFAREIQKGGYHLGILVINRMFPYWLDLGAKDQSSASHLDLSKMYFDMKSYYNHRDQLYQDFESRISVQTQVFRVPDMVKDISDLTGLQELADVLLKGEKKS